MHEEESAGLEKQLRSAAPALPPALRGRTLARCTQARLQSNRSRGLGMLKWAFAGVCVLHWLTGSVLDSQRAALIAGPGVAARLAAEEPQTPDQLRENFLARSHMLHVLMAQRGEWPAAAAG